MGWTQGSVSIRKSPKKTICTSGELVVLHSSRKYQVEEDIITSKHDELKKN